MSIEDEDYRMIKYKFKLFGKYRNRQTNAFLYTGKDKKV